ncbi:hypothetical protein FRC08_003549 [Ceratobasidium sp. 394]|nr:hypothetical protein FRC08_003549 [Ceratobasidium sp. 394]KAG9100305.1 hypothetical protein FS749_015714 [Ceratobasidium sp. UAMH 11750]
MLQSTPPVDNLEQAPHPETPNSHNPAGSGDPPSYSNVDPSTTQRRGSADTPHSSPENNQAQPPDNTSRPGASGLRTLAAALLRASSRAPARNPATVDAAHQRDLEYAAAMYGEVETPKKKWTWKRILVWVSIVVGGVALGVMSYFLKQVRKHADSDARHRSAMTSSTIAHQAFASVRVTALVAITSDTASSETTDPLPTSTMYYESVTPSSTVAEHSVPTDPPNYLE